ncbi:adrenocorticotropic hormone receptor-like [Tachypleus tridentatus]|uniref:adrenocorticotropic hormone receptor-like n=1 Tax=Tachypleus tridentatus TaxID=6853 RepID=UPI003FD2C5EB
MEGNSSIVEGNSSIGGVPYPTDVNYSFKRELYRVSIPIMLATCVISIKLNLIVIISVKCVRQTVSPTLCFSLSLAAADAYASLIFGLGLVLNSLLPVVYNVKFETRCIALVLEAFRLGGLSVSVYHLLALTVNHYVGIARPLHYSTTVTHRTVTATIISIWIGSLCFFFLYFSSVPNQGFQSFGCEDNSFYQLSTFRTVVSSLFLLPLLLMTAVYIHIFLIVRQHQRLQVSSFCQFNRNVKSVVTTLLIIGTYFVCWVPALLYFAVTCLDCIVPHTSIPEHIRLPVGIVANSLIILKSLVNPVIYTGRMTEVQEAVRDIILLYCGARSQSVTSRQRSVVRRNGVRFSSIRTISFRMSPYEESYM